jgi:hypothetical protein
MVAFVGRRLDERWHAAQAAERTGLWDDLSWPEAQGITGVVQEHILAWSPKAVIADIMAKRRILEDYTTTQRICAEAAARIQAAMPTPDAKDLDEWSRANVEASIMRGSVEALASAFAAHPDFRADWVLPER